LIRTSDFIHPEDEAARRNLEAIPGFSSTLKGFLRLGYEQYYHGVNMASKIRLSKKQLPELYKRLPPICEKLQIAEPDFYLEMNPMPNAYTFGDTRIFLTVTSGLIEYLESDEVDAVLAHECGHIVCRHVLYHTMANFITQGVNALGFLGKLAMPVQLGLMYWSRRSELSADRAAASVMGSIEPVVNTMVRLSGGSKAITGNVDIDLYAAQADEYNTLKEKNWDKILQNYAIMWQNHPFAAVRVKEIRKWGHTDGFKTISRVLTEGGNSTICKYCKAKLEPNWKFCKNCGTKL
jgi:Zn-dependent protease with chaperone function